MSRRPFKSGVVISFIAGLAAAPFVKPVLRGTAKASVRVALRARKLAAGAVEDLQDLAAEARAEDGSGPAAPS